MEYRHLPGTIREGYHAGDKVPHRGDHKRRAKEDIPGVFRPERRKAEGLEPKGDGLEKLLSANAGEDGDHPLPDEFYGRIGGSKDTVVGRNGPCLVYCPVYIDGSGQADTKRPPAYYALFTVKTRGLNSQADKEALRRVPMTKIRSDFPSFFPSP